MDTNEFQELVLKELKSNSAYPKECVKWQGERACRSM